MVSAGRDGPNQRAHLQQGEDVSFLAVSFGWHCRGKQELKSISALIFRRPTAKLGALGHPPPLPMFPLQIVKFFMVESKKAAADSYQWILTTLLNALIYQIYLDAKNEVCIYV